MTEEKKSEVHITNNFNAPVGMHVNHVDAIHFRMDGDGTFHFGIVDHANMAEESKATDANGTEGVLELLDRLVQEAIASRPTPKYILLPVRAAKDAGVLPTADLDWVNKRYRLSLNPTNWSSWVNKEDCNYLSNELSPLVERFAALKTSQM